MMLLIVADVVLRAAFNHPIRGSYELGSASVAMAPQTPRARRRPGFAGTPLDDRTRS
jgi:hypothetical protein